MNTSRPTRTNIYGILLAACLPLAACAGQPAIESVAVESNGLGITHVEIEHRSVDGDRVLLVRGIGVSGDDLAIATLRTGDVHYSMEPGVTPEVIASGTELTITVGDESLPYVSPDREAHTIGEPGTPALASFVRLAPVAEAIADEARIRFTRVDVTAETAFAAGACSGANFPTANGNPPSCCQDGTALWHKIATGANINKLANRTVGTACRTSGGATGCTSDCYFGPCAAHIETVPGTNTTAAAVFVPTSAPTQCGRDSDGTAASGGVEAPEAFTGSQGLYAGVTATCAYTTCLSTGAPTYVLTVDVVFNSGVGDGSTTPSGLYWNESSGQVSTSTLAPGTVTIRANALSPYSRAVISGACASVGNYGGSATCNVTFNANKTVSVSYNCMPGKNC